MKFMTLRIGAGLAVVSFLIGALAGPADAGPRDRTLVDALDADPGTAFAAGGTSGSAVYAGQSVGPRFVLGKRNVITEAGAFLASDGSGPMVVEIRPETDGGPDLNRVIATFPLSDDGNPDVISYESARFSLALPAGTYYALFATTSANGYVLSGAVLPSGEQYYLAGLADIGILLPGTASWYHADVPAAVRVLARHKP